MNTTAKIDLNPVILILAAWLLVSPGQAFCQENNDTDSTRGAKTAIEQALKNYEAQRQNEQDELTAQLNFRLGQATENWLDSAEKKRDGELGTFIEQDWDKQARTYMITPVRYDYYLRGYKYTVLDSDVIKTDSMTSPYKATVEVKEDLYAEKYHHPNISDSKLYYYTVTSFYTLDFVYKNDEFSLTGENCKMEGIVNEISPEARKKWFRI
ncbi:MAG: hypothetical protein PHO34_01210 [Candidatus Omnitrophica bacterium]|nr:hypothetical protein [Candidatus Omnitrophota bacterium]MDD5042367.1 hypothetical protein [Candidatus Omnitrophota bacterium]MDD5500655.1 hypothetical protein [Candidatus Omnitrophota bacterium]